MPLNETNNLLLFSKYLWNLGGHYSSVFYVQNNISLVIIEICPFSAVHSLKYATLFSLASIVPKNCNFVKIFFILFHRIFSYLFLIVLPSLKRLEASSVLSITQEITVIFYHYKSHIWPNMYPFAISGLVLPNADFLTSTELK